jgi:hypothetical protein
MTVAWIGFAGGIVATIVSDYLALRQSRAEERITRLSSALDEEVGRREALLTRELAAEDVLKRYREPLAAAAFDLQSRLYNILELDFFQKFGGSHERAEEALRTTFFRLAQYFGWTEILRRDIQFLSFPEADNTQRVAALQRRIARCFLAKELGPEVMIWSDEQRGIGERMIVEEHGKVLCMGYATFRDQCDTAFAPWYARVTREVVSEAAHARLREAQNLLCDLVLALDDARVRYTTDLDRSEKASHEDLQPDHPPG